MKLVHECCKHFLSSHHDCHNAWLGQPGLPAGAGGLGLSCLRCSADFSLSCAWASDMKWEPFSPITVLHNHYLHAILDPGRPGAPCWSRDQRRCTGDRSRSEERPDADPGQASQMQEGIQIVVMEFCDRRERLPFNTRSHAQAHTRERSIEHFRQDRPKPPAPIRSPGCPSKALWQPWWDNKKCFATHADTAKSREREIHSMQVAGTPQGIIPPSNAAWQPANHQGRLRWRFGGSRSICLSRHCSRQILGRR
jgi:hypothetical protein